MSIAIPQWLAPWLIGAGTVGTALALLVAVRAYFQLRRGEYYVIREEARQVLLKSLLFAFILALLTVLLMFLPRQTALSTPPTTTALPQPTDMPTPTLTPPRPTATITPTPKPTATEPFIPTLTPQATLPVTFTQAISGAVSPPADAQIEFWTLAQGVDEDNRPVNPSQQFPSGTERIYLFFRYDGLLPNVPWTVLWYYNGKLLSGGTALWETGQSAGEWYVYLTLGDGFSVGEYEVQVWLGERLKIRTVFSVVRAQG